MKESDKENLQQDYEHSEFFDLSQNHDLKDEMGDVTVDHIIAQPKLTDLEISYFLAACESEFQKLNSILSKNPSFVNMKNPLCDGFAALHFACKFGKTEVIRSLLGNYKADVNIISNSGKTPLHVAVQFKQEEAVRLLLSPYNANKALRDYSGRLPADLLPEEKSETLMNLVGPSTASTYQKHPKAQTPTLINFKKNFLSLGSSTSSDSSSKVFSLFRKGSEATTHGSHSATPLSANSHHKELGHSPSSLHVVDHDRLNLKKNLSFLTGRPSVKHSPSSRAKSPHKGDDAPL